MKRAPARPESNTNLGTTHKSGLACLRRHTSGFGPSNGRRALHRNR